METHFTYPRLAEISICLQTLGKDYDLPCGYEISKNLQILGRKMGEIQELANSVTTKYAKPNGSGPAFDKTGEPLFESDERKKQHAEEIAKLNRDTFEVRFQPIVVDDALKAWFKNHGVKGLYLTPLHGVILVEPEEAAPKKKGK